MARHAPPATIRCAVPTVSGTDASASAEFLLSRNVWGSITASAVARTHDKLDPSGLYLWARNALFHPFQPQFLWVPSERAGWLADWTAVHNHNPLCLNIVHLAPMHNTPGFRVQKRQKWYSLNNWAMSTSNVDRKSVALSLDGLDPLSFSTNSQKSTTNTQKQAGWTPLVTNEAVREKLSDITTDALSGSNLTGDNYGGGNATLLNMVAMHDGSDAIMPKSGAALRSVRSTGGTGFINSIVSSNSQQPIIVRLSEDLELETTGTALAEDSSFEETVETDAIWFWPGGSNTAGFLGLHIIGYREDTAGRCQVYLKTLSKIAHDTQLITPAAGYRYVVNDQRSGSINCDWDSDSHQNNAYSQGTFLWGSAWSQYWDLIDEKLFAQTGRKTLRGWSQASSHLQKRTAGLPNPHGQERSADFLQQEAMEGDFVFVPNDLSAGHGYDCSSTKVERGMRAAHFFLCSIRDNPGGWPGSQPRGPQFEYSVYGDDYSLINKLDATYLRFCLAATKLTRASAITNHAAIEDVTPGMWAVLHDRSSFPVAIEEFWIDFNTNWGSVAPLGSYDPGGGPSGSSGYPEGSWEWATADFGERGFIRRLGNWICAVNMDDAPSGYNEYAPTHLSNPFAARNPDDIITEADMDATGLLSEGESLAHFNPATYVNQRATDRYIAAKPSVWTGFKYGPRQAHPAGSGADSSARYDNDDLISIARDSTKNNGSDVTFPYTLGPLEAVFWEIKS